MVDLCRAFLDSVWLSLESLAYKDMLLENVPSQPGGQGVFSEIMEVEGGNESKYGDQGGEWMDTREETWKQKSKKIHKFIQQIGMMR